MQEKITATSLRLNIAGASGSGATTLGKALAKYLGVQFFDADDFYWKLTAPPYQEKYPASERQQSLLAAIQNFQGWLIAGSMDSWGRAILDQIDVVIFLYVPSNVRMQRLKQRETERYGNRIMPGGDMYLHSHKFLEWAAQYDEGILEGRNLQRHEDWLKSLKCPVIRFDGDYSLDYLVTETVSRLLTVCFNED